MYCTTKSFSEFRIHCASTRSGVRSCRRRRRRRSHLVDHLGSTSPTRRGAGAAEAAPCACRFVGGTRRMRVSRCSGGATARRAGRSRRRRSSPGSRILSSKFESLNENRPVPSFEQGSHDVESPNRDFVECWNMESIDRNLPR